MGPSRRRGRIAAYVSLGCTLVAAAVLMLAPLGSSQTAVATSTSMSPSPSPELSVARVEHESLLQHEGGSVLVPLAVPVVIALLGTVASLFRRPKILRMVSAGLLATFVLLGALSIGIFFLPSAIAMGIAAARTEGPGGPAQQT